MVVLLVNNIVWTDKIEHCFSTLSSNANALKDYISLWIDGLTDCIKMVQNASLE